MPGRFKEAYSTVGHRAKLAAHARAECNIPLWWKGLQAILLWSRRSSSRVPCCGAPCACRVAFEAPSLQPAMVTQFLCAVHCTAPQ
jgi:hypothetical protein